MRRLSRTEMHSLYPSESTRGPISLMLMGQRRKAQLGHQRSRLAPTPGRGHQSLCGAELLGVLMDALAEER